MRAVVITGAMGALGTRLVKLLNERKEDCLVILSDLRFPYPTIHPDPIGVVGFEQSIKKSREQQLSLIESRTKERDK